MLSAEERAKSARPLLDARGTPSEPVDDYVRRVREGLLSAWPEEVVINWIYRHSNQVEDWSFLPFERFTFELATWPVGSLPGREAFRDPRFFDSFSQRLDERATANKHDWLAHYMLQRGTWNTPPILLEHLEPQYQDDNGRMLRVPYQLLEGHRRLSFAGYLRMTGLAKPQHQIWVVRSADAIVR